MKPDAGRPSPSIERRGGPMNTLVVQVAASALPRDAQPPCRGPSSAQLAPSIEQYKSCDASLGALSILSR